MAIPRTFIDDLLVRTDIVELIDSRVHLKKTGKNYSACCPFHNEKSPSFTVSHEKQFYHCFGCGAHGNAISFLMEYDRLEFPEAIEELARMHGMEVPKEQSTTPEQRRRQQQRKEQQADFHQLMHEAAMFYRQQLARHQEGQHAIAYLKKRGLSGDIAKRFGIGYAPAGWDNLMRQLGSTPAVQKQLVELGMLIERDSGSRYDRFRERIMFPIRDRGGRVVGFGGRILDQGEPKYLNSPETPIFKKGQELYGLYEAKQAHRQLDRVIVVEGYMDVVALAQHGIDYAVASLGTSTTSDQLQRLFRQTHHVTCCYDGDQAGQSAAIRALENALPLLRDGNTLDFVFLPDGEDPDSLVRSQGQQGFEQLLSEAQPLSDVLFTHLLKGIDAGQDAGQSALVAAAAPLIEQLPDGVYRTHIEQKLARLSGLTEEQLQRHIKRKEQPSNTKPARGPKMTPMRRAIGLLVQHPELAIAVPPQPCLQEIKMPGMQLFLELLDTARNLQPCTSGLLLEQFRDRADADALFKLAAWSHGIEDAANREKEFIEIYAYFLDRYLEQRANDLLLKQKQGELSKAEKQEYVTLLGALKGTQ